MQESFMQEQDSNYMGSAKWGDKLFHQKQFQEWAELPYKGTSA